MKFLWTTLVLSTVLSELPERAMEAYVKYCGIQNTCNLGRQMELKYSNNSVALQRRCKPCVCDKRQCSLMGLCCPNVELPRVSTEGFKDWNLDHFSSNAIGSCSKHTNATLQRLCSRTWRDIADSEFSIVIDEMNVAYKNKYCALCNGVKQWKKRKFVIDCSHPRFPLHSYSSKDELLSAASQYGCIISFEEKSFQKNIKLISRCNVTGKWATEDAEIYWACTYFATVPYLRVFKNIFCYMCNTGMSPTQPYIDSCISHNDIASEKMCFSETLDARFYPYRNQYCKECNKLSNNALDFVAYDSYIKKPVEKFRWQVYISPNLCYIRHLEVYRFLKISNVLDSLCKEQVLDGEKRIILQRQFKRQYQNSITDRPSRFVNISAVFDLYKQKGGISTWWCDSMEGKQSCSCSRDCFDIKNCCPGMVIFSRKSDCVDFNSYTPSIHAKCRSTNMDKIFQYYCERNEDEYETIIDFIPIYSFKRKVHYKNLFCKMCSEPEDSSTDGFRYFWNVLVSCKEYIDVDNYFQFAKSFKELRKSCDVDIKSSKPRSTFVLQSSDNQCPHDVSMKYSLSDLEYLCIWGGDFIYSTCKSKYKNIFCEIYQMYKECSEESCEVNFHSNQGHECKNVHDHKGVGSYHSYQFTFNPVGANLTTKELVNDSKCQREEFYDVLYDKCRTLKCIQGKFLYNGKCVPLLDEVTTIAYHTEMTATVFKSGIDGSHSTEDVLRQLHHKVDAILTNTASSNFDFTPFHVTNITSVTPVPCNITWGEIQDEVNNVVLKITLVSRSMLVVSRQALDEHVLGLMSQTYKAEVFGMEFNIRKSHGELSKDFLRNYERQHCITTRNYFPNLNNAPHYFAINKFIVCPQITLEEGEYHIVNSHVLVVNQGDMSSQIPYLIGVDEDVSVCLLDFLSVGSFTSAGQTILSSLTLILPILWLCINVL